MNSVSAISSEQSLMSCANEVVNQMFYGTLMREFRSSQKPTLFDKGMAGQAFVRQLDAELVKRMSQKGMSPLAEALVRQLRPGGARQA